MAMRRIGRLGSVGEEIRAAFVTAWIDHKMLPMKVDNRRAPVDALYVLMPGLPDRYFSNRGLRLEGS